MALVDFGTTVQRRKRWSRWWLLLLAPSVALAALYGGYSSVSICGDCGMYQHVHEWHVPLTSLVYWRSESAESTPLSRAVQARHLASPTVHRWLFAAGGGNGIMCAIGPGRHLGQTVAQDDAAAFIEAMVQFRGPSDARRWLTEILKPDLHGDVAQTIGFAQFPPGGFSDAALFERWWDRHLDDLRMVLSNCPKLADARLQPTP